MILPTMIPVRQRVRGRPLADVAAAARGEFARVIAPLVRREPRPRAGIARLRTGAFEPRPRAGIARLRTGAARLVVGIAVGSRGTANLPTIIAAVVAELRAAGARAVIIPAMGSHGGATPAGQREILASLGVTPQSVGAPLRASMAVERLGETAAGVPIWFSREALRCDAVIVVNRIKQHSDFSGPIESGLMKMIAIGLGKQRGAQALHYRRVPGLRDHMPQVAREIIGCGRVLAGLAILENGDSETTHIEAVPAAGIEAAERRLLRAARRLAPRLPFDEMDALIVDWMGKDISGVGLDPKVLGRMRMPGEMPEPRRPRIRNLVALRLTPASHGNALGIGFTEFIPRSLADAIDWQAVKANSLTSGFLERAKLPLVMDSDRAAIEAALTVGQTRRPQDLRVVRIHDTAHVGELWISPALRQEARRRGLAAPCAAEPLRFDRAGRLLGIPRQP